MRAADSADRGRSLAQLLDQDAVNLVPACRLEAGATADEWLLQPGVGGHVAHAELALVAGPLLVYRLVQASVNALELAHARIQLDVTAVRALRADGALGQQVPGP